MKHNIQENKLVYSNVSTNQSIKAQIKDTAIIISYLRDKMYSNKIQTPVQEYLSNGLDAMGEINSTTPMKITLPTGMKKEIRIRDYGPGLSPERMEQVFTQYAASDKTGSNDAIGGFGLGSKSGWAYGPVFMVESYYNGVKRIYVAQVADNQEGSFELAGEFETTEPNGLEIIIPVRARDEDAFVRAAYRSTCFWKIKPVMAGDTLGYERVCDNISNPIFKEKDFAVYSRDEVLSKVLGLNNFSGNHIILNCNGIPYNLPEFDSNFEYVKRLNELFCASIVVLDFKTGELDIQPDRERIANSEKNKELVYSKIMSAYQRLVRLRLRKLNKYSNLEEFMKVVRKDSKLYKKSIWDTFRSEQSREYSRFGRASKSPTFFDGKVQYRAEANYSGIKLWLENFKILKDKEGNHTGTFGTANGLIFKNKVKYYSFARGKKSLQSHDVLSFEFSIESDHNIIILDEPELSDYKTNRKIKHFISKNNDRSAYVMEREFLKLLPFTNAKVVNLSDLQLPPVVKRSKAEIERDKKSRDNGTVNCKVIEYNYHSRKCVQKNTEVKLSEEHKAKTKFIYMTLDKGKLPEWFINLDRWERQNLVNYFVLINCRLCAVSERTYKKIQNNINFQSFEKYKEDFEKIYKNESLKISLAQGLKSPHEVFEVFNKSLISSKMKDCILKRHLLAHLEIKNLKRVPSVIFEYEGDSLLDYEVIEYQDKLAKYVVKKYPIIVALHRSYLSSNEKAQEQLVKLINAESKSEKIDFDIPNPVRELLGYELMEEEEDVEEV